MARHITQTREPAIADAVERLIDECLERSSTHEETFIICHVCGDCDSHTCDCFVPALLEWQQGSSPSKAADNAVMAAMSKWALRQPSVADHYGRGWIAGRDSALRQNKSRRR